jgi:hypothetical protein
VREVLSTFGPGGTGGRQRTTYITPDFSLGSASADYGSSLSSDQDQMLRAELGSSSRTPALSVIADYLDAPGSSVQMGDFQKVTHLLTSPAAAQKSGAVLALLRVPAKDPGYTDADGKRVPLVNLASNVVVPAQVDELLLDGTAVNPSVETRAGARPTLVVRIGKGALAVGVVDAGGLECERSDGSIAAQGAADVRFKPLAARSNARDASARLAVYHATSLPQDTSQLAPCFARLAILMAGAHCDSPTCAHDLHTKMAQAIQAANRHWDATSGDWNVHASFDGGPDLHVHRNVRASGQILAREIDGKPVQFAPLAVNGTVIPLGP